jgi:hypothetical protein
MSSANRYPGIDPRVVASVRHHARRASTRLPGMELEDLEQELMLHVHRRLSLYDPGRADLWTYVDRILSSFVVNLAEAAGARSRGAAPARSPWTIRSWNSTARRSRPRSAIARPRTPAGPSASTSGETSSVSSLLCRSTSRTVATGLP